MIERFNRFSFAMREINKNWHKLVAEELEQYGLKGAHGTYLLALYEHPEGLTAPRLCELTGKDKADASRMLRSMEQAGIVVKQGEGESRYGGIFALTDAGQEIGACIHARAIQAVEFTGADLTDEERETMYQAIDKIMLRLRTLAEDGMPANE